MRTTINLDEQLAKVLKETAHREGRAFTLVVNDALRAGLTARGLQPRARRYRLEPSSLGGAEGIDLDRALRLADTLEERAIAEKLALRK